jgi:hypothetical protein
LSRRNGIEEKHNATCGQSVELLFLEVGSQILALACGTHMPTPPHVEPQLLSCPAGFGGLLLFGLALSDAL